MRVLLVESDGAEGALLSTQLEAENLEVRLVNSPAAAFSALGETSCRAIIIGRGIAEEAGRVVQRLRATEHGTPVVVLTDNNDPAFKVALLDSGADDVIVAPYPPEVLTAQIRSLLRRCVPTEAAVLRFEDLALDLRSLQVTRQGQVIPSTSRELAVLEYFMRNRERVITRNELAEAIWDESALPESNVIEVFIARLRRKVDRPFEIPLIHTIVGRGYMLSVTKPGEAKKTQSTDVV